MGSVENFIVSVVRFVAQTRLLSPQYMRVLATGGWMRSAGSVDQNWERSIEVRDVGEPASGSK